MLEKDANGVAAEQIVFKGLIQGPMQVSPDGKELLYFSHRPASWPRISTCYR